MNRPYYRTWLPEEERLFEARYQLDRLDFNLSISPSLLEEMNPRTGQPLRDLRLDLMLFVHDLESIYWWQQRTPEKCLMIEGIGPDGQVTSRSIGPTDEEQLWQHLNGKCGAFCGYCYEEACRYMDTQKSSSLTAHHAKTDT